MTLLLGIDTGGTYTDAVLFDKSIGQQGSVVSASKSLTTKHDLSIGITGACSEVLKSTDPSDIKMVSLSSTLATNAIVEKHGNPVCLIMAGHDKSALDKANLRSAVGSDPCYFIDGGHDAGGNENNKLDTEKLREIIQENKDKVSAFAVCSMFATRNPAHENKMREIIRQEANLPVTASHDLADALDAPRRALTAFLNARLISQLHQLITSVQSFLDNHNIKAPLMIVQGNGSLMSAEIALDKPVETIMSGPAASIIGAGYLTGKENVFVSDIGGTTTDVAVIENGLPILSPKGAVVHGWETMVEAINVYTVGLGGDSEVRNDEGNLVLGPRRVTPLALLAQQHPKIINIMKVQLEREFRRASDGVFAHRLRHSTTSENSMSVSERFFWDAIEHEPKSLEELLEGGRAPKPLQRLVDMGLVIYSAFTPSDASHILGLQNSWDKEASILGGKIYALKERRPGYDWAENEVEFSKMVLDKMTLQSGEALMASAYLGKTGIDLLQQGKVMRDLISSSLQNKTNEESDFSIKINFNKPIVGIGAPAETYYPAIAESLGSELIIPEYSYAANAVGAVVGKITKSTTVTISAPNDMIFRVHIDKNIDFTDLEKAIECATEYATKFTTDYVSKNLGTDITTKVRRKDSIVKGSGQDLFMQSTITVLAVGVPNYGK